MRFRNMVLLAVTAASAVTSACAVRLGGAKPEGYNAIGLRADAGASASDIAARIKSGDGDLVLLSSPRDSAWFADVAAQSGMTLTRPGRTGPSTLGLLTRLKSVGDTSLSLAVTGGGRVHIKDALYTVDKSRTIDLMLVSLEEGTSAREGVRTLLNYIATDVMGTSAVLFGIEAPRQAAADSATVLLRAAFNNVLSCGKTPTTQPQGGVGVAMFFGPEARLSCTSVKVQAGNPNATVARVVVER